MSVFQIVGTVLTGIDRFDTGISQLMVYDAGAGPVLVSVSGSSEGAIVSYGLNQGLLPAMVDTAYLSFAGISGAGPSLTLFQTGAAPELLVGGIGNGGVSAFALDGAGQIGASRDLPGLVPGTGLQPLAEQTPGGALVLAAPDGSGFTLHVPDGTGGLSGALAVADTATTHAAAIGAMASASIGGSDLLLVGSQSEYGVTAYLVGNGAVTAGGSIGQQEGLGLMVPTAIEMITVEGTTYAIVASAPGGAGQSGALSVMAVGADGSLTPTDHVLDTLTTRFGGVQEIATLSVGGRAYLVAGGGDQGISLFVLSPDGQLIHLESLAGTRAAGLDTITGLEMAQVGNELQIFVSTGTEAGIAVITVSLGQQGMTLRADASGQVLAGQGNNDILNGGAGDDVLTGAGGDDILCDGAGTDSLTGGAGADLFVLAADATTDTITDFDPGRDRIDLSYWPMLYDPSGLSITATSDGAILTWRTEVLVLHAANGQPLDPALLRARIVLDANHAYVPPAVPGNGAAAHTIEGTSAADSLTGTGVAETFFGGQGKDTIRGGGGDDILNGGNARDYLHGDAGADVLNGDAGHDLMWGGDGNDTLRGGGGKDRLWGDGGDDMLYGEAGNDRLWGRVGADTLHGGSGNDMLRGQAGDDILYGEAGNDRLWGGVSNDQLYGGDGNDILNGDAGQDVLWGNGGNDRLAGGDGADMLHGGDGQDTLRGGAGDDTLTGGAGDDFLNGQDGQDRLAGGAGNDTLIGGRGDDVLTGGAGDDTLTGGGGADMFVFVSGAGTDRVADYRPGIDMLEIAAPYWAGMTDAAALVASTASVTAQGVVFDFGGGNVLILEGLTSTAGLDADIALG